MADDFMCDDDEVLVKKGNKLSDILFYFDYRIRATDKTRLKGPVIEIYQVENCQYSDF